MFSTVKRKLRFADQSDRIGAQKLFTIVDFTIVDLVFPACVLMDCLISSVCLRTARTRSGWSCRSQLLTTDWILSFSFTAARRWMRSTREFQYKCTHITKRSPLHLSLHEGFIEMYPYWKQQLTPSVWSVLMSSLLPWKDPPEWK